MKKILILYNSIGYGHKKIGENIGAALQGNFQVEYGDILEIESGALASGGSGLYGAIVKYWPGLWNFFYTNKVFLALTLPLRTRVAGFKASRVRKMLEQGNYAAVVCTHVNASAIVSYLKQKGLFTGKFIITFSDFHLHSYWLFKNADLYLANIEEQKQQMMGMGYAAEKILVCGITLPQPIQADKPELKRKFGIGENEKVVLMLSGSQGMVFNHDFLDAVKNLPAHFVVVAGKNQALQKELEKKYGQRQNIRILGYVDFMPELYRIADLVVTKPGGLTISECLMYGLPIVIHTWLPGQEQINYEFLLKNRLILPASGDPKQALEQELASGKFAASLKSNLRVSDIVQHGQKILESLTDLL